MSHQFHCWSRIRCLFCLLQIVTNNFFFMQCADIFFLVGNFQTGITSKKMIILWAIQSMPRMVFKNPRRIFTPSMFFFFCKMKLKRNMRIVRLLAFRGLGPKPKLFKMIYYPVISHYLGKYYINIKIFAKPQIFQVQKKVKSIKAVKFFQV